MLPSIDNLKTLPKRRNRELSNGTKLIHSFGKFLVIKSTFFHFFEKNAHFPLKNKKFMVCNSGKHIKISNISKCSSLLSPLQKKPCPISVALTSATGLKFSCQISKSVDFDLHVCIAPGLLPRSGSSRERAGRSKCMKCWLEP